MNEQDSKKLLEYLKAHAEDYLFKAHESGRKETSGLYSQLKRDFEENARHISIINDEMGGLRDEQKKVREELATWKSQNVVEHEQIKTNLSWVMKFQWLILGTSVAALITGVIKNL